MAGVRIDETNANILRRLLKDARTSFTELAEENDITPAAAISRYKNLKKSGVIGGSFMQINPQYLGFNCTGYLGLSVEPQKSEEIEEALDKEPYILSTWIRVHQNNIGSFFATPNLEYFNTVTEKLNMHPYIKSIHPFIHVGFLISDHPENLIIRTGVKVEQPNSKERQSCPFNLRDKTFVRTPEIERMDKLDRNIVQMLSYDARTSFNYIAKKLKISTSTAINRYQKLKNEGAFLRSTIDIDLGKLGYTSRVMINFNIKPGIDASELQKSLLSIPNLIVLSKTLGKTDMLAILPIATIGDFFKIKAIFHSINAINVIHINLSPILHHWPYNFFSQVL